MNTVFFRKENDGTILAVFAFDFRLYDGRHICNGGAFTCYSHTGQHSAADLEYIKNETTPASRDESAGLLDELRAIGYSDIIVIKNIPPIYL